MSGNYNPDDLAYGEDYSQSRGSGQRGADRGLIGDTFRKFKTRYNQHQSSTSPDYGYTSSGTGQQPYYGQPGSATGYQAQGQSPYPGGPPTQPQSQRPDLASKLLGSLQGTFQSIGSDVAGLLGTTYPGQRPPSQYPQGQQPYSQTGSSAGLQNQGTNRFGSFAAEKPNNDVKWYVDGCGYFWAVSEALEAAKDSIWILDWWLSPELYLRRPPSKNEQWRLDRVLQRAAQRGVKVNIIVYKEVTQALTLSSAHTKHALEALSPNISVFRHPDHLPDAQTAQSSLISSLQGLRLDAAGMSRLGADALKGVYGFNDDVILYWAHHEKLCLIDGTVAFMGGLDLCFGRWDTNQHSISDAHPTDLSLIVFPGQDMNDARIMDFNDVAKPFQNKLDRTKSPRMGWSDISLSLSGNCVDDLRHHFIDRWNFIYDEKYNVRADKRYSRINDNYGHAVGQQPVVTGQGPPTQTQFQTPPSGENYPPPPGSQPYSAPAWQSTSRPYTPNALNAQPAPPVSHSPVYGQQSSRPPSQHYQNPSITQSQGYSQAGPPNPSQHFPPPPPGPPPQSQSPIPQIHGAFPSASGHSYAPYAGGASELPATTPEAQQPYPYQAYQSPPPQSQSRGFDEYESNQSYDRGQGGERGLRGHFDQYRDHGRRIGQELSSISNLVSGTVQSKAHDLQGKYVGGTGRLGGPMTCQVLRSCTRWSNGTTTESSIQNAYIDVIQNSQHFVYIENQFFITATGDHQKPVKNLIGKALVDRILRAARGGQKYKVVVIIPSVPGFAGDLMDDSSLGTRAIMEYQYDSINRGGHSIMELIAQAGYNPMDYIRFYNLRNYDRINAGSDMRQVEQQSGVSYEDARKQHDDVVGAGYGSDGEGTGVSYRAQAQQYQQYQAAAQQLSTTASPRWDSVAECYMLGGEDIRNVPWDGTPEAELDAFVSEELYIHSKVLIADDRIVICGSANLNDRSQLGYHDSEIAILINDPTPVQGFMAGQPWTASRFASSLRRQLFRKHLGLIKPQDMQRPDANFAPVGVPNAYDWDSPEDNLVRDPLSDTFLSFWNTRARTNTEVFRRAFRAVPDDTVTTWMEYKEFYEYYFQHAESQAQGKDGGKLPPKVEYAHVVRGDFPGGIRELKELLSRVKGTLVEMPLCFLQGEDIAKEGLTLNALTEEIYT